MKNHKIAVSLWLFHIDLWPEIFSLLLPFADSIKLYIGLCNDNDNGPIIADLGAQSIDHIVSYHDNYGADIQSFLYHIKYLISEPYFLKIHTKKSMWGVNFHVNWRELLLHGLIGNRDIFDDNMAKISQNNIGAVCHPRMLLSKREASHTAQIVVLCKLLDIDYTKVRNGQFVAGNMFFGKTSVYKQNLMIDTKYSNLIDLIKPEQNKVNEHSNGTFCHALERLFGYTMSYAGYEFATTAFNNSIKIYNQKLDQYLNLIETHKTNCYLLEDPNVYGNILSRNSNSLIISWLHKKNTAIQKYVTIRDGIITQEIS